MKDRLKSYRLNDGTLDTTSFTRSLTKTLANHCNELQARVDELEKHQVAIATECKWRLLNWGIFGDGFATNCGNEFGNVLLIDDGHCPGCGGKVVVNEVEKNPGMKDTITAATLGGT